MWQMAAPMDITITRLRIAVRSVVSGNYYISLINSDRIRHIVTPFPLRYELYSHLVNTLSIYLEPKHVYRLQKLPVALTGIV